MRCSIIGCGETGALWNGEGFSIGVNDCLKFGKPVNALVCVNIFSAEPHRAEIVNKTKTTHGFYSTTRHWEHRKDFIKLEMRQWGRRFSIENIYYSHTSPFIAISLAAKLGYTEIVVYGMDLTNHKYVKGRTLDSEIKNTLELVKELEKCGIKVYLYSAFGAFKDKIPSL